MSGNGSGHEFVGDIVARHAARPERLVQILVDLVERDGWISEDTIRQLADALNLSRAEVHGVVSFYHDFRTSPPGRHVVKLCRAEACQAVGCEAVADELETRLGIGADATTADGSVTLETVYCLGNCALGPAALVDGKLYGRVDAAGLLERLSP